MKKILAFALMAVLLCTCLIACDTQATDPEAMKNEAAAIFTLDVNPGVRIYVEEDGAVLGIEATNEDGKQLVAKLDLTGIDYEAAVEQLVDEMEAQGFLEGDAASVLLSVEKKTMDIADRIGEKIGLAFEKHGKEASIIEQELDALGEKIGPVISEMAKKYNISEGKAHLIERIREEFPELSEEELAALRINELGMMLEQTSDDIKGHFKKIGKAIEEDYLGRANALAKALESLELSAKDVTLARVHVTRGEGKMLYEARFVFEGMEYRILLDAESGEILESTSEEFKELDAGGIINDFCGKHGIDVDAFKDQLIHDLLGGGQVAVEKLLTRGEVLAKVLKVLNISEEELARTDVQLLEAENGSVFSVTLERDNGDVYKLVVEAYTGTLLLAELNGVGVELPQQ